MEEPSIFMIQWRWSGEKKVHILDITETKEGRKNYRNDIGLVRKMQELLSEADVVIGQNSKKFDEKWIKKRIALYDLNPVGGYVHHDLKCGVKKHFNLQSYSLDYMSKYFCNMQGKIKTEFSWWKDILQAGSIDGNKKALAKAVHRFRKYGGHDIILLDAVYQKVKSQIPEFKSPPMINKNQKHCSCGGVMIKRGIYRTVANVFQRYACTSCGRWDKGYKSLIKKEDKLL
jgi:hypothetical protein